MRRLAAYLVLVAGVTTSACGATERPTTGPAPALDENVLTLGFEGTALGKSVDPEQTEVWSVVVESVFYSLDRLVTSEGLVIPITPRKPGDVLTVSAHGLRPGTRYVILSTQSLRGDPAPIELGYAVYDAATLEPVGIEVPPVLRALTSDPSASVADIKSALAAYLQEAAAYREAVASGDPNPPIGEHLARAFAARGASALPPATVAVLGMSETAYLDQDPLDRQLLPLQGDLPASIVAALRLEPIRVLIIYPSELTEAFWAIGLRSETGTIGPVTLDRNAGFVEIVSSAGRSDHFTVVAWPGILADPDVTLRDSKPIPFAPRQVARGAADQVLVIDLGRQTVGYLSDLDADDMIARMLGAG